MKKILFSLLLANLPLCAMDFITRFGPNSPVYNEPLYFSGRHLIARPEKKVSTRKYRDNIRKKIETANRKKRAIALD